MGGVLGNSVVVPLGKGVKGMVQQLRNNKRIIRKFTKAIITVEEQKNCKQAF